ncbi:Fructose-1,6-bisphosphatase [Halanaeroarchaeum sp. HSR-CO]|uniref:class 1 fructose-bisphosphatase n=1 Tax=Halanaeroarchaeum sp. HSR-CO TaxID=2866382 RepID=UPI00217DA4B2|nr:class 1 fructose-bisphosphatase [Halanaeroarchaeum sp. HSR-CO]UWG47625.1 Fructose-1,6-bisphosphatase [Halanaeroarchaeum sp. HSR-CO]
MSVSEILDVVATAAPEIRSGLPGRRTKIDEQNRSGERQLAADVWADELLGDRLAAVDSVGAYASEERDEVENVGDGYLVAVDPLDGSSNLRSNNPMGTVVGVYDDDLPTTGRSLVAAAFVLYGPITTMVVARDGSTTEYVVEAGDRRDVGEIALPEEPTVYGFGGRVPDWPAGVADYVETIEGELKLRYGGAMIADVSQVLTYGGIFAYPMLQSRSSGKLRILFEGAPIAYIVESAGGSSSDGTRSLLDVEVTEVHQRTPVFVGNADLVDRLEATV